MIEKILDYCLAMDPESRSRLARLEGKVVRVNLLGIKINCQLVFKNSKANLRWSDFLPEDLVITGTPLRLLQLKFTKDRQQFFADDVLISGDMSLAQDVLAIFDQWQPDWEECASDLFGDAVAYRSGNVFKNFCKTVKNLKQQLTENLQEYISEELSLTPPREELQDFILEVDDLRLQVDRLEAQIMAARGSL